MSHGIPGRGEYSQATVSKPWHIWFASGSRENDDWSIMRLPVKQTLLLILLPMLATFAIQRLYLHWVGVQHIRANGLIIHHLFFGVATIIPAAFVLAFGARNRRSAILSRVALGIGSAMVLDEMVYLIATQASDSDYISALSLRGAVIFMSLGTALLLALYQWCKRAEV